MKRREGSPEVMEAQTVSFRLAVREDLPAIVRLLADDPLGSKRETYASPLPESYHVAFDAIDHDPNNEIVVAETVDRHIVGVLQITFIPYLTYRGGWRTQIEGVRVAVKSRSTVSEDSFSSGRSSARGNRGAI
jgi:hypothetical protein